MVGYPESCDLIQMKSLSPRLPDLWSIPPETISSSGIVYLNKWRVKVKSSGLVVLINLCMNQFYLFYQII